MKRWRIHYQSKAGGQVMTLLARTRGEAELLAGAAQGRRAQRYDITHQRLGESLERGEITKDEHDKELERRKLDFSRYDVITGDEVGAAEAPLKIVKIEEEK